MSQAALSATEIHTVEMLSPTPQSLYVPHATISPKLAPPLLTYASFSNFDRGGRTNPGPRLVFSADEAPATPSTLYAHCPASTAYCPSTRNPYPSSQPPKLGILCSESKIPCLALAHCPCHGHQSRLEFRSSDTETSQICRPTGLYQLCASLVMLARHVFECSQLLDVSSAFLLRCTLC